MRIALIGNMNNNNFSLMRYFRDLGEDAHLLLYANDGKGTLSHFTPEADTWEISRWAPFIHQTDIPNSHISALNFPLSTAIGIWSKLRRGMGAQRYSVDAVTKAQLRHAYGGYDCLVASGASPAALARIDRALDVFYPYSPGVEFLGSHDFNVNARSSWVRRFIYSRVQRQQLRGLANAFCVICTDRDATGGVLEKFGITSVQRTIPMVYNREVLPEDPPTAALADAHRAIQGAGLSLLHHARLMWTPAEAFSDEHEVQLIKNSDWLIRAYAALIAARPTLHPRLFLVEYGPDVQATKDLVVQLRIDRYVTWLPKMARRELMWLLARVSVGVGEFMNQRRMIWGGTGWEALASGKPLLQGFQFEHGEFEDDYGHPPPPMLPVKKQEDILERLLFVADNPIEASGIGFRAREWFDSNNGIRLARRWLYLLMEAQKFKQNRQR